MIEVAKKISETQRYLMVRHPEKRSGVCKSPVSRSETAGNRIANSTSHRFLRDFSSTFSVQD
jgi:hypothetical protein